MQETAKYPQYLNVVDTVLEKYTYGDMIDKAWLLAQFEIDTPDVMTKKQFESYQFEFLTQMDGLRTTLLEEHNIALKNIKGKGYLLVHPKNQADVAMTDLKASISKELKKCVKTLTYVNLELLGNDDVKRLDESRGKLAAVAAFSRKSLR
jgi:hypothetical protein